MLSQLLFPNFCIHCINSTNHTIKKQIKPHKKKTPFTLQNPNPKQHQNHHLYTQFSKNPIKNNKERSKGETTEGAKPELGINDARAVRAPKGVI
ncbi:hypothetical protein Scep_002755 [Stephania cephalantha]|uniref:Uncharacterized protein n=1 Tax=Stephania cephalantha TaxID=152367 RepID=A0AAP0LEJ2_9MAGN